jgi:fibronectin type 3 domain-containing protein
MLRRDTLIIVSVIALLFCSACGKKGDPLPRGLPLPAAISDLTGQVKDGVLFLSFTLPAKNMDGSEARDLAGFRIFKTCGSCLGAFELFKEVRLDEAKGYTIAGDRLYIYDDDLNEGFEYGYKVFPVSLKGQRGEASNVLSIKWRRPPAPPKQVSFEVNDGVVELKWSGEPGVMYNIYRSSDRSYPLFPLNNAPVKGGPFLDSGLENGKTYQYEVRAVSDQEGRRWEGEGLRIEAIPRDKTPPAAPVNVSAVKEDKGVLVSWSLGREKDVAGYNLYRTSGGKDRKLNGELLRGQSYRDEDLPEDRYVSYHVTSVDTSGNESTSSRESIIVINE